VIGFIARSVSARTISFAFGHRAFELQMLVIRTEVLAIRRQRNLAVMQLAVPVPDFVPIAMSSLKFH
jgi:hypothetical protein